MKTDVAVLGAGIVGLSTAIHLARRGKSVLLVDRRGAGEETSFGNAGLIQREGVVPYGFPHDFGALFRYALNNTIDAHYHLKALPGLVPFLVRYISRGSMLRWSRTRSPNMPTSSRHPVLTTSSSAMAG